MVDHTPRGRRPGAQEETPRSLAKEQSWRTASRIRSLLSDEEARVAVFHRRVTMADLGGCES